MMGNLVKNIGYLRRRKLIWDQRIKLERNKAK